MRVSNNGRALLIESFRDGSALILHPIKGPVKAHPRVAARDELVRKGLAFVKSHPTAKNPGMWVSHVYPTNEGFILVKKWLRAEIYAVTGLCHVRDTADAYLRSRVKRESKKDGTKKRSRDRLNGGKAVRA